jgi:hypothetical protein
MDYSDRFDATLSNDVDDDKQMLQNLKQNNDKRYFVRYEKEKVNGYLKTVKTEMYGSGDYGSTIRDAETGEYYSGHLVGSTHEDMYFKTSYTLTKNQDSLMLYYISPEHYERHQHVILNDDVKQKWHQKKQLYLKKNQK